MYKQEKITKQEYEDAMDESAHMTFAGASNNDDDEDDGELDVWDWYTDALFEKVLADLMDTYGYSEEIATMQIYQGGITIHSAMDRRIQNIADSIYTSDEYRPEDREILSGFYMMDYSGRVLATVGSFEKKEGNRLFSNAIDAGRQSGSVIKPVSIYAPAIDNGMINFSTILKDEPVSYTHLARPIWKPWKQFFRFLLWFRFRWMRCCIY